MLKPLEAKRLGEELVITVPDWTHYQLYAMAKALHAKFKNRYLLLQLKNVNEKIVSDNYWYDTFWGVCKGEGKNMLGKMLTNIKENNNNYEALIEYIENTLIKDVD